MVVIMDIAKRLSVRTQTAGEKHPVVCVLTNNNDYLLGTEGFLCADVDGDVNPSLNIASSCGMHSPLSACSNAINTDCCCSSVSSSNQSGVCLAISFFTFFNTLMSSIFIIACISSNFSAFISIIVQLLTLNYNLSYSSANIP